MPVVPDGSPTFFGCIYFGENLRGDLRSYQPDVALFKFLTEARAVRLLPANVNNLKFCQKATAAFPVLEPGIDSPPAQQLLKILVENIPFEMPGMKCSPPPPRKKKKNFPPEPPFQPFSYTLSPAPQPLPRS